VTWAERANAAAAARETAAVETRVDKGRTAARTNEYCAAEGSSSTASTLVPIAAVTTTKTTAATYKWSLRINIWGTACATAATSEATRTTKAPGAGRCVSSATTTGAESTASSIAAIVVDATTPAAPAAEIAPGPSSTSVALSKSEVVVAPATPATVSGRAARAVVV
jgi:hypothetical protein